jgi:hypothetical protein
MARRMRSAGLQPPPAQHGDPRLGGDLRLTWCTPVAKRELQRPLRRGLARSEFGDLPGHAVEVAEVRPGTDPHRRSRVHRESDLAVRPDGERRASDSRQPRVFVRKS